MTDNELLSKAKCCPFCGKFELDFITNVDNIGGGRDSEFIVCISDFCLAEGAIADDKVEALTKWNKRY